MGSATAAPSAPPVTSGQSINVVSWILLCIMLLSVATRLGTKLTIIRKLEADDGVACLAMVSGAAHRFLKFTTNRPNSAIQQRTNNYLVNGDSKWLGSALR